MSEERNRRTDRQTNKQTEVKIVISQNKIADSLIKRGRLMIQKISTNSTRYFTIFLVSDSDVGNCYSMIYLYQITTVQNHSVLYGFHTKAQVNCWLWIPKGFLHKSNHWMWLSLERTFL